jgi:hypothetical protein
MSSSSPPPDNSVQVKQMEIDEARRQQEIQDKKDAEAKAALAALRTNSRNAAGNQASQFFTQQGLDPSSYTSDINSYLDSVLSGIAPDDPNPGAYFKDAGQTVYNQLETGARTKAANELDRIFAPNFETKRIPFTLDDPYLDSIQAEQRASADAIVKNMLDRGVITNAGYGAAEADLDKQAAGVKSRLNELGTTAIAGGQQSLRDIANQARQDAAQVKVGQNFDPYSYSSDADQAFNDFINNLGTNLRAKISGNMFNTTGLAAIAGAAQGAGNTAFNPAAAAGISADATSTDDTTKDKTKESIF